MTDAALEAVQELVQRPVTRGVVRIGPRGLRWFEAGSGSPAVVLATGAGDPAAVWTGVMRLIAPRTRVVAYDRAGLGASDAMPELPTITRQVDDLEAVVIAVTDRPCLLVGQSYGGLLVQLLAWRRRDLAAGLVLVDPAHEDMLAGIPGPIRRLVGIAGGLRAEFTDRGHAGAVRRESRGISRSDEAELRREAAGLRDARYWGVPVSVLSAGRGFPRGVRRRWTERQAELALASANGQHLVVEGSGHGIHVERPEVVAGSVEWVLSQLDRAE